MQVKSALRVQFYGLIELGGHGLVLMLRTSEQGSFERRDSFSVT